jgi:diguanylate cyclase
MRAGYPESKNMQPKVHRGRSRIRRSRRRAASVAGLDLGRAMRVLRHAGIPEPVHSPSRRAQLQSIIDALCDLSVHDGLTGLVNATFFRAVLTREIDRSARTGRTCALLVLDIDHFKRVNDTHGHPAGDMVLQAVARTLLQSIRNMDTAARIGGEEFAVILAECGPEEAVQAATRLHALLNPIKIPLPAVDMTLRLTVSGGLVWTHPNLPCTAASLLEDGDREMYLAKQAGRSRLSHPPMTSTQVSIRERDALFTLPFEEESDES